MTCSLVTGDDDLEPPRGRPRTLLSLGKLWTQDVNILVLHTEITHCCRRNSWWLEIDMLAPWAGPVTNIANILPSLAFRRTAAFAVWSYWW